MSFRGDQTPELRSIEPFLRHRYEITGHRASVRGRSVYRAVDRGRGVRARLHLPVSEEGALGLVREVRSMVLGRRPGLLRPIEVGDAALSPDGRPVAYVIYDELPGYGLSYTLSRLGVLSVRRAVDLALPLLHLLGDLHAQGIPHGGIDPSTVWLHEVEGGRLVPTLVHFGDPPAVEQDQVSPCLVPEQLDGQGADARSDLFAIGALLLRCITGEDAAVPSRRRTSEADGIDYSYRNTAEWSALCLDPRLARLLRRALDPEPLARFDDAASMAESLQPFATPPGGATPATLPPLLRVV